MLLNENIINHVSTPIAQQISLFSVLWDENPLQASGFLLTKSVVTFAHKDPRSGLNLWTYQFDAITLLTYGLSAIFGGRLMLKFHFNPGNCRLATLLGLCGCVITMLSASYMTVIEHCSGATWVGFVSLYGMGFSEFQLYPMWQWLCAGLGVMMLAGSWVLILRRPKDTV